MAGRSAVSGGRTASLLQLGLVDYGRALELQAKLVRLRQEDKIPDTLVLLEHPPVITIGRNAGRSNLLVSDEELERRGVCLYKVERGGDITFHGPGQLVGYPVFRLGSGGGGQRSGLTGVRRFVEGIEQALILALAELGIHATIRPGFIGVWVGDSATRSFAPSTPGTPFRKIASLGIAVKRGVTMHGFALNVTTDLSWFGLMNPCGLDRIEMTSVKREGGKTDRARVRAAVVQGVGQAFGLGFSEELAAQFDFFDERLR